MSYRTPPAKAAALAAVLACMGCQAAAAPATGCPGRIAPMDGIELFDGPPARNVELPPDRTIKGVNIWSLTRAAKLTMVCSYEDGRRPLVLELAPTVRECRQDVAGQTFQCK
ncbi:MAG: hypothetical protein NVS2B11_13240 [Acetobacteraceae bacterium]